MQNVLKLLILSETNEYKWKNSFSSFFSFELCVCARDKEEKCNFHIKIKVFSIWFAWVITKIVSYDPTILYTHNFTFVLCVCVSMSWRRQNILMGHSVEWWKMYKNRLLCTHTIQMFSIKAQLTFVLQKRYSLNLTHGSHNYYRLKFYCNMYTLLKLSSINLVDLYCLTILNLIS